jgi:hypothetical protein
LFGETLTLSQKYYVHRHEFGALVSNSFIEVIMMPRFKDMPQVPDQMWLMPPSLDEMVPRDSEVRLLCEVMDHPDWSILESSYRDRGTPPTPPPKGEEEVWVYSSLMKLTFIYFDERGHVRMIFFTVT